MKRRKETGPDKGQVEKKQKGSSAFRKKLRGLRSMRLHVFSGIILIGAVVIVIVAITIRMYYLDRSVNTKIMDVREYADQLTLKLIANAYLAQNVDNTDIDRELGVAATLYGGRIIVIDGDLRIVYDSFGTEKGKTLISAEAVNAIKGVSRQYINRSERSVELTQSFSDVSSRLEHSILPAGSVTGAMIISFSVASEYEILNAIDRRIAVVGIVALIALVLLAYIYSKRLTGPLKLVSKHIRRVADGFMDEELEIKSYAEVEDIVEALNETMERIRKMEASRQEFVSNVSHELKTPITSIKVLADSLLMQEDVPAELYREFLGDINEEIDRENKIITDLLALVKLDKKNTDMNITETSINELLEVIMKRIRPIAKARNIELVLESYRPVMAEVDEVKLSLAFSNLIENAVKYNRDSGWVHVSLNSDHRYFFVKVTDSGVGIPEDEQALIFDRFYRVDKTRSRETGGTGLGLAITKSVILKHNGQIKVASEMGVGTTFTVRLPLSYIPESEV